MVPEITTKKPAVLKPTIITATAAGQEDTEEQPYLYAPAQARPGQVRKNTTRTS